MKFIYARPITKMHLRPGFGIHKTPNQRNQLGLCLRERKHGEGGGVMNVNGNDRYLECFKTRHADIEAYRISITNTHSTEFGLTEHSFLEKQIKVFNTKRCELFVVALNGHQQTSK